MTCLRDVAASRSSGSRSASIFCGVNAAACTVMPMAPRQSVLYFYPDDVTAYHRDARAKGLDVPDLEVTFYGMREFRIDDPDGNRLWIGQTEETVPR